MLPFTFYAPTYFSFGPESTAQVGSLVRRFGGTRILLHYGGKAAERCGALDAVRRALCEAKIEYVELAGVVPNPRSDLVRTGIALCRTEHLDFILAVGGGSVIDSAKAIAFGAVCSGDFWRFFANGEPVQHALPVGTVLTIAASGSEGSMDCVITSCETGEKICASGEALRPRFSILNPMYTLQLPAYQSACGITDMFAHVCERYFSNTPHVSVSDQLCEGLMRAIVQAGTTVISRPEDYNARAELMWAGTLAHNDLCGVGREQDWASHMIEHALSAQSNCAHGAGLAVVLPAWMEYVYRHDVSRFARFAREVFGCAADPTHPDEAAFAGICSTRAFFRSLRMPQTLSELGIDVKDVGALSARVFPAGVSSVGAFLPLGRKDVETILTSAARVL